MPASTPRLRVRVGVVAIALGVAACEPHPSKLDDLPESDTAWLDARRWVAIEERALPLSIRHDLLHTALAIPDRGTIDERAAALVAWMDAGGSIPVPTTMAAFGSPPFDLPVTRVVDLVAARPDDERLFEAALYAASTLRRDGLGYNTARMAGALFAQLRALRAEPPAYAPKYAPTDAEVSRTFASEAMFARRLSFELNAESRRELAADLAMWSELAEAPHERAAFLAFVDHVTLAHPNAAGRTFLRRYADQMFRVVDDYQTWLSRAPTR